MPGVEVNPEVVKAMIMKLLDPSVHLDSKMAGILDIAVQDLEVLRGHIEAGRWADAAVLSDQFLQLFHSLTRLFAVEALDRLGKPIRTSAPGTDPSRPTFIV
jgi:hypothetical protein